MHDGRILERSSADLCEAAQEVKFEAILNSADDDGNADGRRIHVASRREAAAAAAAADGAMRI